MSMTDRNTAFAENETHLKMTRPLLPELLRRIEEGRFQTSVTAKRTLSSCPNFVRRLQLQNCLEGHLGCVNTVSFCEQLLISGSDDKKIKLWDWQLGKQVLAFHSGHIDNVFQARFLPASTFTIASSAADGQIRAAVLSNHGFSSSRRLWQHDGRAHKIALTNNPSTFLSCGEDGSIVHHDLRQKHPAAHCCVHNSTRKVELYSVCTNPSNRSEFCIAGQQKDISVFDLRRFGDSKRAIHLCSFRPNCLPLYDISCTAAIYNRKGEILASYNDDFIYLFNRSVQENLDSEIVYNQGEDNGVKLFQSPPGIHQFFSASVSVLKTDFCKEQTDDDSSMSHSDDSHLELSEEGYGDCFTTYDEILRSYSRRISDDYGSTEDENEFSVEIDGEESTSSSSEENDTSSEMESEEETDLDEEDLVNQTDSEGLRYFLDNGVSNVFLGHRNLETVKGVAFLGVDDEWVISGSDCGYIYIWSASTGNCHASFKADSYVVNCLEPNTEHFLTFATSGIDNDIKIWTPTRETPVCLDFTDVQRMESNVEGVLRSSIGRKSRSTSTRLMGRIALVGGALD